MQQVAAVEPPDLVGPLARPVAVVEAGMRCVELDMLFRADHLTALLRTGRPRGVARVPMELLDRPLEAGRHRR